MSRASRGGHRNTHIMPAPRIVRGCGLRGAEGHTCPDGEREDVLLVRAQREVAEVALVDRLSNSNWSQISILSEKLDEPYSDISYVKLRDAIAEQIRCSFDDVRRRYKNHFD